MSMSLYSLSKSYTNQYLMGFNSNSLFSTSKTSSLEDLISKYTYIKKNYKDIKNELKNIGKEDNKVSSKLKDNELVNAAKSQTKVIVDTRLNAGELKDSVNALADSKIYEADKDGKVDTDKILTLAKDFVKNYNDVKEIANDSTSDTVVRQAYYMVNTTNANKDSLAKIGISIKSDNTLELDEDKFKKANVSSVKSLFQGSISYGKQIESRANGIKSAPTGDYITYTNKADNNNSNILESYLASIQNTSLFDYFV